jgi:pyridoxal phosphate enzyme (YggS family)
VGTVEENLAVARERIARACEHAGRSIDEVRLLAVTKTVSVPTIRKVIDAGMRLLGENRVQEALSKYAPRSPGDWAGKVEHEGIELHMIGTLQRNKARHAALTFDAVQSLDRPELADALERAVAGSAPGQVLPVYIEVNVTGEATKSGVAPSAVHALAEHLAGCKHLRGVGLMTIARYGADERELRETFSGLRQVLDEVRARHGDGWRELSMGMSDDYEIAIEEGSTLVRLGRAIFGERSG